MLFGDVSDRLFTRRNRLELQEVRVELFDDVQVVVHVRAQGTCFNIWTLRLKRREKSVMFRVEGILDNGPRSWRRRPALTSSL